MLGIFSARIEEKYVSLFVMDFYVALHFDSPQVTAQAYALLVDCSVSDKSIRRK